MSGTRTLWLVMVAGLAMLGSSGSLAAQDTPGATSPVVPSMLLTLDQDRMFIDSVFGQRVQSELDSERTVLAAENRRIETELIAEEQSLTEARAQMTGEDFSELATAFDAKVQQIRSEQDSKARALQTKLDQDRAAFRQAVGPVLVELMQQRGAVAILDESLILLAFDGIDVTQQAIDLIDARIGDGAMTAPE